MKWVSAVIIALASYLFIVNHFGNFLGSLGLPEAKSTSRRTLSIHQEARPEERRPFLVTAAQGHREDGMRAHNATRMGS